MQNAGQNFLSGLQSGGQFGGQMRQKQTMQALTPMIAQNTPQSLNDAKAYATQRGDLGAVEGIQGMIAKMDEKTKAEAAMKTKAIGQIAAGGLKFAGDPKQAAGYIQYWGPQLGFNDQQIQQAMQNPEAALRGLAANSEEVMKAFAGNQENFTLNQGQSRFSGDGSAIASVAPEAKVLGDGAELRSNDGALLGANAKDPLQAAPMSEYQRQSLGIKRQELDYKKSNPTGGMTPLQKLKYDKEMKADATAQSDSQNKAKEGLALIDRLIGDADGNPVEGDLRDGFKSAYGGSGFFTRRWPGSKGQDAWANIKELVGPKTLDELSKMKGTPSDKDIELVAGTATALNEPGISDEEAFRKLNEMRAALKRIAALPDMTGISTMGGYLTADELAEYEALKAELGQ